MDVRAFLTDYCGLAGGLALIGVACLACTDSEQDRDDRSANPMGPPVACTMIGCEDGLRVEIRPASGWPAGEYRFRIQADEVEVTCRGSLPLPSCTESPSVTCDTEDVVQIIESGCALPADSHAFPGLSFDPELRPEKVEITITRDGELVGAVQITPEFERVQPNGPGCPPICEVAHTLIQLDL